LLCGLDELLDVLVLEELFQEGGRHAAGALSSQTLPGETREFPAAGGRITLAPRLRNNEVIENHSSWRTTGRWLAIMAVALAAVLEDTSDGVALQGNGRIVAAGFDTDRQSTSRRPEARASPLYARHLLGAAAERRQPRSSPRAVDRRKLRPRTGTEQALEAGELAPGRIADLMTGAHFRAAPRLRDASRLYRLI
jgi:hypothetical protein